MNTPPFVLSASMALLAGSATPAAAAIVLSSDPLSFGSVFVGTSSEAQLGVTNTGPATATISSILISGTHASQFSFTAAVAPPFELGSGESEFLTVRCTPTSLGAKSATLTVTADTGSDVVALNCTGVAPDIHLLTPGSVQFGEVTVGTASTSANVTVANYGNAALTVSDASFSGMSGQFGLTSGPLPPLVIAPGGSRTWQVRCQPTSNGLKTATFSMTSDDPDESTLNVSLYCTGTNPQADLSIQKSDGGGAATPGQPITYTITASNAGPTSVPDAQVTDMFPPSVAGVTWTCLSAGGASCTTSGSGHIGDSASLPTGGSVTYSATGTVDIAATSSIVNTATVAVPSGITDPDPSDNTSQVSTAIDDLIFTNGFEAGPPLGTVVAIQTGLVTGAVALNDVVITARRTDIAGRTALWVADASGPAPYNGLYVFRGSNIPLGPEFAIGSTSTSRGRSRSSIPHPPARHSPGSWATPSP